MKTIYAEVALLGIHVKITTTVPETITVELLTQKGVSGECAHLLKDKERYVLGTMSAKII